MTPLTTLSLRRRIRVLNWKGKTPEGSAGGGVTVLGENNSPSDMKLLPELNWYAKTGQPKTPGSNLEDCPDFLSMLDAVDGVGLSMDFFLKMTLNLECLSPDVEPPSSDPIEYLGFLKSTWTHSDSSEFDGSSSGWAMELQVVSLIILLAVPGRLPLKREKKLGVIDVRRAEMLQFKCWREKVNPDDNTCTRRRHISYSCLHCGHRRPTFRILVPTTAHQIPQFFGEATRVIWVFALIELTTNFILAFAAKWPVAGYNFKAKHAKTPNVRAHRHRAILFQHFWSCPSKTNAVGWVGTLITE